MTIINRIRKAFTRKETRINPRLTLVTPAVQSPPSAPVAPAVETTPSAPVEVSDPRPITSDEIDEIKLEKKYSREDCYNLILENSDDRYFDDETIAAIEEWIGVDWEGKKFSEYKYCIDARDFAAAVEFFWAPYRGDTEYDNDDGFLETLLDAKEMIRRNNYEFFPLEVSDDFGELGKAIWYDFAGGGDVPEGYEDYVDFERIGKDFQEYNGGDFTRQGFFAPVKKVF